MPFCSAICPYCDFAVKTARAGELETFPQLLRREVALWPDWATPFDTIYLGGGTPSLLSPAALAAIVEQICTDLPMAPAFSLSMEANPEDVTRARARDWRSLGVTTLSLGVQSFLDDELRRLGRRHSSRDALSAVADCLSADFNTVSVDLMFGLPGQTCNELDSSLSQAISSAPQHISCYQLTVHGGTTFGRWRERGKLVEISADEQWLLYERLHQSLQRAGYDAYEVSNFALAKDHQSRHNSKYWRHSPYLGLGPSAHSFDGRNRWWNERRLDTYAARLGKNQRPIAVQEQLTDEQLALETLMLGLRTVEGVDTAAFDRRFGFDIAGSNQALIEDLEHNGFLALRGTRLEPTVQGLAVADALAAEFQLARASGTLEPSS